MTEGGDAAEQVVRMMLSGGEVSVRLAGSAFKNGMAMLMALAQNHKKVYGKTSVIKILRQTRDIRNFPMSREQFERFKRKAKKHKLLFSAVEDKRDRNALIDVILPVTEVERANVVFEKIGYEPKQKEREPEKEREEQTQKKEHRSEPDSHDTRDNSSTRSSKERTTSERPSVEQQLKANKEKLERNRADKAPTRQKTRSKGRAK